MMALERFSHTAVAVHYFSRSFNRATVEFAARRLRLIKMHRGVSCLRGRKGINKSYTRTVSGICIMGHDSFIRKTRSLRRHDPHLYRHE